MRSSAHTYNEPSLRHGEGASSAFDVDAGHRSPDLQPTVRKPYSFSYTIFDENTGLTHARDETADEEGVVVGSYEVLDPDCVIRRVTYRASKESGFNVVDTQTRPCNELQKKRLESGGEEDSLY